jgi:hypothetical protein
MTIAPSTIVFKIDNRHRDVIGSALLHLHHQRSSRGIRYEAVVGPSVIRENTLRQTADAPGGSSGPYGQFLPASDIARTTVGVTGGIDAAVAAGHHLSVVPQVRVHWVSRADASSGDPTLGLASFVFRAAIGIRGSF